MSKYSTMNIGDEVEVVKKGLKTTGQKGIVVSNACFGARSSNYYVLSSEQLQRECERAIPSLKYADDDYKKLREEYIQSIHGNIVCGLEDKDKQGFVLNYNDMIDYNIYYMENNDDDEVSVRFTNGRIVTFSKNSLKISKKANPHYRVVGTYYQFGGNHNYYMPEIKFNLENLGNNYKMLVSLCSGIHMFIDQNSDQLVQIKDEKELERLKSAKADMDDKKYKQHMESKLYTVVFSNKSVTEFINEEVKNKESHQRYRSHMYMFSEKDLYNHPCVANGEEFNANISFTVTGRDLDRTVEKIVKRYGVTENDIKIYELNNPKTVNIKVSIE